MVHNLKFVNKIVNLATPQKILKHMYCAEFNIIYKQNIHLYETERQIFSVLQKKIILIWKILEN